MGPDSARFKDYAAGIQSLVTALGLAAAGVWAIYTFNSLGTTEKAQAEIAVLEHEAAQQPVLSIDIKWHSATAANGRFFLTLITTVRDDGKKAVNIGLLKAQLLKLADGTGAAAEGAPPTIAYAQYIDDKGKLTPMTSRAIRSGQTRTIAFVLPPLESGRYLFQLDATYSGLDLVNGQLVDSSDEPIEAVEQRIVTIPDER